MRVASIATGYACGMAKVMISLPDALLERIDREARRRNSSRSALLREAVSHELGQPDRDAFDAALAKARAALEGAGSFESADVIRDERAVLEQRERSRM